MRTLTALALVATMITAPAPAEAGDSAALAVGATALGAGLLGGVGGTLIGTATFGALGAPGGWALIGGAFYGAAPGWQVGATIGGVSAMHSRGLYVNPIWTLGFVPVGIGMAVALRVPALGIPLMAVGLPLGFSLATAVEEAKPAKHDPPRSGPQVRLAPTVDPIGRTVGVIGAF